MTRLQHAAIFFDAGPFRSDGTESDDEFNEFVTNEVIDPSSSDDEDDLFFSAAQMIIEDYVNNPGRIGSVEGHEALHCDRLLYYNLLLERLFLR
jgi:hypothetical protein